MAFAVVCISLEMGKNARLDDESVVQVSLFYI